MGHSNVALTCVRTKINMNEEGEREMGGGGGEKRGGGIDREIDG